MIANIGTPDRILRIVIGLALGVWFFMDQGAGTWHWLKLIVAVVLIGTAAINFCPIYSIFGLSTKTKQ